MTNKPAKGKAAVDHVQWTFPYLVIFFIQYCTNFVIMGLAFKT